jgi:two-component system, chemotaxis family, CheB/CheR fusion protein
VRGGFSAGIMPYRTLSNVIDGVVMTVADISLSKQLEAELPKSQHIHLDTDKAPS